MVINLNGVKKDIPSCYEEMTARQYEMIVPEFAKELEQRDHFKIFQILTGTDYKDFEPTAENEVTIWNAIRWLYEQPFEFGDVPKVVTIKDKLLSIPEDITELSIGQNIHLKQILGESKYLEENICSACAIYLQPLYDDAKFNFKRAMQLKEEVEKMPAYIVRPIGFFLLNHASTPGRKQTNSLKRMISNLMRRCAKTLQRWQRSNDSYRLRTYP